MNLLLYKFEDENGAYIKFHTKKPILQNKLLKFRERKIEF